MPLILIIQGSILSGWEFGRWKTHSAKFIVHDQMKQGMLQHHWIGNCLPSEILQHPSPVSPFGSIHDKSVAGNYQQDINLARGGSGQGLRWGAIPWNAVQSHGWPWNQHKLHGSFEREEWREGCRNIHKWVSGWTRDLALWTYGRTEKDRSKYQSPGSGYTFFSKLKLLHCKAYFCLELKF